jgi:hypothetical protein
MRGATARELRKIANFDPHRKREYKTWSVKRNRFIRQLQQDGSVKLVVREVELPIHECVDGPRNVYMHLKKFYKGYVEEKELSVLPDNDVLKTIQQQAVNDTVEKQKEALNERSADKETISTNSSRTIPSSDESGGREDD